MIVRWDPYAQEDWQRLSLEDAERVAVAVRRWAESGVGLIDVDEAGRVYRLYVRAHAKHLLVVLFVVEGSTDTMHVIQVRRAGSPPEQ